MCIKLFCINVWFFYLNSTHFLTGQCVEFFFILVSLSNTQEYSEDSNSEPNVDLENQYYNSKALKEDDPKAALSSFQKVHIFF